MQRKSNRLPGRKSDGKCLIDQKRRRLPTDLLPSSSEDSHAFVSSVSSYFSCQVCFADAEKKEPVITFCGHVFCWSCLYKSISLGIRRLRGECPTCKFAVDLCPRTKTVCPIYYIKGPQAFPPPDYLDYFATDDSHRDIKLGSKSEGNDEIKTNRKGSFGIQSEGESRSEGIGKSDKRMERVKVDPTQRPPDKRPILRSSLIGTAFDAAASVTGKTEATFFCLLRDWKSTIDRLKNIMDDMQSCCRELSLHLVNEQKQGFQLVSSSPSASFCSSSYFFHCNSCYGDATDREPIITYCGHVFCKQCFYDTIIRSDRQCPVCGSAMDVSSACPISHNGETNENQNCEIREKWQEAVLILDPNALQFQIYTLIGHLNNEIAVRTKNICDIILKVQHGMENFRSGLRMHLVGEFVYSSDIVSKVENFMKENADQLLARTPNIKSPSSSGRLSQVVQNKPSFTTTTSSSSASSFFCGCCHEATLHNPVVTYCTHLFCWHCLYLHIETNGYFSEDGSLHGPCPVCKADNIVISSSNAKLTIIPICNALNFVSQEYQKIEGEEDNIKRLPPCPVAKRISMVQLNRMKDITHKMMCKINTLMGNWHLQMDDNDNIINFKHRLMKYQRHRLLLGLLDGWGWAYRGSLERGVVATAEADTRLNGLSEHWMDIVDVDSACTLIYEIEVLLP